VKRYILLYLTIVGICLCFSCSGGGGEKDIEEYGDLDTIAYDDARIGEDLNQGDIRDEYAYDSYVTPPDTIEDTGTYTITSSDINGKVTLPENFKGNITELKAITVFGESNLEGDGSFTIPGISGNKQLLIITDKDDNPVLLGWVKPGEQNKVSTLSTAAYILFIQSGAVFLPPSAWSQMIDLFIKAPETSSFSKFLDQKIAENPSYLSSPDEDYFNELKNTLSSIIPPVSRLVLVNPSEKKSGVTILIGDKDQNSVSDINQITLMNEWRRRSMFFIERKVAENTYKTEAFKELPPTDGLNGIIGSLVDCVIYHKCAYVPVYSGPWGLGNVPDEKEKFEYRIINVGIGRHNSSIKLTPEQEKQKFYIQLKSFLVDLIIPLLFGIVDYSQYFNKFTDNSELAVKFMQELINRVNSGEFQEFMDRLTSGDVGGAINSFFNVLANNEDFKKWFIESLQHILIDAYKGQIEGNKLANFLRTLYKLFERESENPLLKKGVLSWLEALMTIGDLSAVLYCMFNAQDIDVWEVTVTAPKVIITPAKATLSCGEKAGFKVTVKNAGQVIKGDLIYNFKGTGKCGDLEAALNPSPEGKNNFTSTKPYVYYIVHSGGTTYECTDQITVVVEALVDSQDGKKKVKSYIGTGRAEVKVQENCISSYGYAGNTEYNSGCTHILSAPSVVYPGDKVNVTAKGVVEGVCGGPYWVWMSYATKAELDGVDATQNVSTGIYDFCYWGVPQPMAPGGVGVLISDNDTHTITFTISDKIECPVCIKYIADGSPCSSNPGNTQVISAPAVVMSGSGGTHGWSTVRFFEIKVNK